MGEGCRILVVDDDPDLRWMVEKYLSKHEFSVTLAEDGVKMRAVRLRESRGRRGARSKVVGAINSPKILELSGVGNPDVLSEHGIETHHESTGIGENLQDHLL